MARVRNKDSRAELLLRQGLHARGVRYRLHVRDVPGRPDLAIRKYRFAVFVDGDLWHGNEHTRRGLANLADLFPTNTAFWVQKITRNMERDRQVNVQLADAGWHVVRLWASDVLDNPDAAVQEVIDELNRRRAELAQE